MQFLSRSGLKFLPPLDVDHIEIELILISYWDWTYLDHIEIGLFLILLRLNLSWFLQDWTCLDHI